VKRKASGVRRQASRIAPDHATIIAQATPPGEGGIAVIRVSGPDAIPLTDRFFSGKRSLARIPGYTIAHGYISDPRIPSVLDEVLVSVFRSPHSYTGENMTEISCHGGIAAGSAIIRLLLATGKMRPAERGEFTRRAVLNGKLDLAQAEAIPDLVRAPSEMARQKAAAQLFGAFSRRIDELRGNLLAVQTDLTAALEFGDDLPAGSLRRIDARLHATRQQLDRLVGQAESGPLLRQGALVVIVGKPNVGKSSLFNCLLEQDRAIVTPLPGTTRDALEANLSLGGIVIRLVDTAGWRARTGRIEAIGKAKARHYADRADALLAVLDSSRPLTREDKDVLAAAADRRSITVLNKTDLEPKSEVKSQKSKSRTICNPQSPGAVPSVRVSCRTGAGIPRLRSVLARLFTGHMPDADFIANQRHLDGLRRAARAVDNAARHNALDVRVQELGSALEALHELTGKVTSDEILDQVFSQFCIGK
jgi:tRNA modification GTPase